MQTTGYPLLCILFVSITAVIVLFLWSWKSGVNSWGNHPMMRMRRNNRRSLRMENIQVNCTFIVDGSDGEHQELMYRKGKGHIIYISTGGVRLRSRVILPLREGVHIRLFFYLGEEKFALAGRLVRKQEDVDEEDIMYGFVFSDVPNKDRERIMIYQSEKGQGAGSRTLVS